MARNFFRAEVPAELQTAGAQFADELASVVLVLGRHRGRRVRRRPASRRAPRLTSTTPTAQTTMPATDSASSFSPNSAIGEQRRHRRHQIEQAGKAGRRRTADQPVHQPHRPDRQHQHQPGHGEDEFAAPVDHARLEGEGGKAEQRQRADILHQVAGAPVDAAAIALLVERAERDADAARRSSRSSRATSPPPQLRSCSTSATPIRPSAGRAIAARSPSRP